MKLKSIIGINKLYHVNYTLNHSQKRKACNFRFDLEFEPDTMPLAMPAMKQKPEQSIGYMILIKLHRSKS